MIKNTLILLLTLVVAGLWWMNMSESRDKAEIFTVLHEKIGTVKRQIAKAREASEKQVGTVVNKPAEIDDAKKTDRVHLLEESEVDIDKKSYRILPEKPKDLPDLKSVQRVPNEIKKRQKEDIENLNSEDIKSILAILNSAKTRLRKTSFDFQPAQKKPPADKAYSQTVSTKKNSPMGPKNRDYNLILHWPWRMWNPDSTKRPYRPRALVGLCKLCPTRLYNTGSAAMSFLMRTSISRSACNT